MWPWEHVAVGYLLYSGYVHLRYGDSPGKLPTLAVAFGALFPDLVDKPLAWSFEVLASGVSVAHSVFTAVAVTVLGSLVLGRFGYRQVATAFSVAYLAHLPSDAVYSVFLGGPLRIGPFFWPLVTAPGPVQSGFLQNFVYYLAKFLAFLGTPRGVLFLTLEVLFLGTTVLVWVSDDCPGLDLLPWRRTAALD